MGLKRSSHQDLASEEENNPTHSMSSVDLDVDETGEEGVGVGSGHDTQESPETVVRAKFAFTGEGEDEVRTTNTRDIINFIISKKKSSDSTYLLHTGYNCVTYKNNKKKFLGLGMYG